MEEGCEVDGIVTRKSPRFVVRKISRSKVLKEAQSSVDVSAEEAQTKKRKRTFKEKAQPTIRKGKKKQVIGYKCCPQMLYELIQSLSPDQKKWVEELGFGALLLMKEVRIPKLLTLWLIDQVDWKRKCLVIGGRRYKIKKWIKRAIGCPQGDLKVPFARTGRGKSKIRNPTEDEKEFRAADGGRGIKVKDIIPALPAETDPIKFKKQFMLVLLCIYLAPTSGHFINRSYRAALVNVDQINQMDWPEFIANYLLDGIRDYMESNAANVNVHGCVHILPLMYIDIVTSQQLNVPEGTPRVQFITTDLFELLESLDIKHDRHGEPSFGNMEVKSEVESVEGDDQSEPESMCNSSKANSRPKFVSKAKTVPRKVPDAALHISDNSRKRHKKSSKSPIKISALSLDAIESQYSIKREKVYQRCFESLRSRLRKLDSKRENAIKLLLSEKTKSAGGNKEAGSSMGLSAEDELDEVEQLTDRDDVMPEEEAELTSTPGSPPTAGGRGSPSLVTTPTAAISEVGGGGPAQSTEMDRMEVDAEMQQEEPAEEPATSYLVAQNASESAATKEDGNTSCPADQQLVSSTVTAADPSEHIFHSNQFSTEQIHSSTELLTEVGDSKTDAEAVTCEPDNLVVGADTVSHSPDDVMIDVCHMAVEASEQAISMAAKDLGIEPPAGTHPVDVAPHALEMQKEATDDISCHLNDVETRMDTTPRDPLQDNIEAKQEAQHTNQDGLDVQDIRSFGTAVEAGGVADRISPRTEQLDKPHSLITGCSVNSSDGQSEICRTNIQASQLVRSVMELDAQSVGDPLSGTGDISSSVDSASLFIPIFGVEELQVNEPTCTPVMTPPDIQEVVPLTSAIPDGQLFVKAGSVNTAIKRRPKRIQKNESKVEGIAECIKYQIKGKAAASHTYLEHVEEADPNNPDGTKIRIRGFHITENEFVQSLLPDGAVGPNFMWLCCVAIMEDWGSRSKIILNQAIVKELMDNNTEWNLEDTEKRLRKLPLKDVQQIYIPVPLGDSWILIVVSLVGKLIEIYDSMRSLGKGESPYREIWDKMGPRLQSSFNQASGNEIRLYEDFPMKCAQIHTQPNACDTGFEVIRALECHNGKDLIGYGKNNSLVYRKEIAHTLVYHRFNDMNPIRKNVSEEQSIGEGLP